MFTVQAEGSRVCSPEPRLELLTMYYRMKSNHQHEILLFRVYNQTWVIPRLSCN